ncbi:transposase, partial [Rodentibacter pneumotropicus]
NGLWDIYCALSYGELEKEKIINYIKNQKVHHQTTDFRNEMITLFQNEEIKFDSTFFEDNV